MSTLLTSKSLHPPLLSQVNDSALPATKIKLVFFDIDGTLIDAKGTYSTNTTEAIKRIQRLGVKTAVASGRPHYAARFVIDELALDAVGMFNSGATLYDPKTDQVLQTQGLAVATAQAMLKQIRRAGLYCELYCADAYYFEPNQSSVMNEVQRAHSKALRLQPRFEPFDQLIESAPLVKLLVGACDAEGIEKIKQLELQFPQCLFAYAHMASHPHWVFASILDGAVNKPQCFKSLCDLHQVSADEVMAIGDAHSDMDFLRLAGVGVAMGNAKADVQAVANFVTLPVAEDGAAYALNKLVW